MALLVSKEAYGDDVTDIARAILTTGHSGKHDLGLEPERQCYHADCIAMIFAFFFFFLMTSQKRRFSSSVFTLGEM